MTQLIWDQAFHLLMINEGGYVNDCRDAGGETKFGISKASYPNEDICNLTEARAKEIYRRDYWNKCKCDYIPDALSVAQFDFAVHSGTRKAIKYLQQALGVKDDGIIGNQTIGACNRLPIKGVLENYLDKRLEFMQRQRVWKFYARGWANRINRVRDFCFNLV